DGRTLVPLRVIAEMLGAEVDWNSSRQQATITTAAYTVTFTIGTRSFTVNEATKTLDVPAEINSGRTMVPIRAIAEAIGAKVDYNAATTTATVDYFTTMTGSVKITGSTTVQPIAQAAADKLNSMNSGLSISVAGGGSGAGVNDAIAGTNNIGMSSRELTSEELDQLNCIAVANDGIAVIVHPSNPVRNLSADQAAQIFLGEINNWKDVGGNDAPILVQTRETGSGTRVTLEEMLLSRNEVIGTATPHTSSSLIKQAVAREANSIGFDSIGFVDSTVKAVPINNIAPTSETVKSGSYIMGRSLYVVTKGAPSGSSAMFIDYLRTAGCQKNIVEKEGYIGID
ncbi:MAG: phosphate ABC transporter substrate-binding protein PstS family protein, partial [Oscillospiraceae bacterium]|nr:phosphate ABC transporter substrate-binding protein PstS family protein [Oscillospiraceae bacterium]